MSFKASERGTEAEEGASDDSLQQPTCWHMSRAVTVSLAEIEEADAFWWPGGHLATCLDHAMQVHVGPGPSVGRRRCGSMDYEMQVGAWSGPMVLTS